VNDLFNYPAMPAPSFTVLISIEKLPYKQKASIYDLCLPFVYPPRFFNSAILIYLTDSFNFFPALNLATLVAGIFMSFPV